MESIELFKKNIVEFFKVRHDAIDEVIECEIGKYGNNVRLKVAVVHFKRGWIYFLNHPRGN